MFWIVVLAIVVFLGWFAVIVIRYNLELGSVRKVADTLSSAQIEEIWQLIERIGSLPSKGFIGIFREVPHASGELTLRLPDGISEYPWGGMVVRISVSPRKSEQPLKFELASSSAEDAVVGLCKPRWLAVPTIETANKKGRQSVFSIDRYMRLSPDLASTLREIYPRDPQNLLTQLIALHPRAHSTEPFDQLRCGLSAAWIQAPRFPKCSTCGRPMRLILQVPGMLLGSRLSEGAFYFFGCTTHPEVTAADRDWG
jgi:hypothetical protein